MKLIEVFNENGLTLEEVLYEYFIYLNEFLQ